MSEHLTSIEALNLRLLDLIPSIIMVVDDDVRLQYANVAAKRLIDQKEFLKNRTGDLIHCVHSIENPGGCGHGSSCGRCLVRGSVRKAIEGTPITRVRTVAKMQVKDAVREMPILVTTIPFEDQDRTLVLLMLEDISELMQLGSLIPICSHCKRIRNDENYWEQIEGYLKSHVAALDFTHGICPDCSKKLYPRYVDKMNGSHGQAK